MKRMPGLVATICALLVVTGCNLSPNTSQSTPPTQVSQAPQDKSLPVLAFDPACPGCLPGQNQPGESSGPKPAIYLLSFDAGK